MDDLKYVVNTRAEAEKIGKIFQSNYTVIISPVNNGAQWEVWIF